MAIIGIGTDLVEIDRIRRLLLAYPQRFPRRILGAKEREVFAEHAAPEHYLAKRFAAKEAAAKALGTGIRNGVNFSDIETISDEYGKPSLIFHGEAERMLAQQGKTSVHLSLSDEKAYATAFVIIERCR